LTPYGICGKTWTETDLKSGVQGAWFLHHDNASAHSALFVLEFLTKSNMNVIPHLPYSPDLVPCDFFHFPELKTVLKEWRFNDVTMIQAKLWDASAKFHITDFKKCFEWWCDCWARCISPKKTTLMGST
jgi:hypothetical protein